MSVPGTYARARAIGDLDVIWEEDAKHTLLLPDGREVGSLIGIVPDDQFPMLKQGYACAQCFVILNMAYPENCPTCNFPIRDHQTEYLQKMFVGNIKTGPSSTLEDERLLMQDMRARQARELGIWTPPTWI